MFDSHPSNENDEAPELGESNSYDNIAAYLLKLRLEDKRIAGNLHKVITFDYAITKQSVIDYFMRAIDPVLAISHRGFMGNISSVSRTAVKETEENITFLTDVFKNLDFWNSESESVGIVGFLRLLGFDLVTYPADFLCMSRKTDIVNFNVTDYDTVKDNNNINTNYLYQYMVDKCAKIQSPYSMLRMKVDDVYMKQTIRSEAVLDEVKFLLNNKGEGTMEIKLELEKLTDKDYMFGVFDDLNGFITDVNELWTKDSDKIGDWIDSVLKSDVKEKIENKDAFIASIKTIMDNHDKFDTLFTEWNDNQISEHNKEAIKIMIDAIGVDSFKLIMDHGFNPVDEEVAKFLEEYQKANPDSFESINSNILMMSEESDYYKELALGILTPAETVADNDPVDAPEGAAPSAPEGAAAPESAEVVIHDGLNFATEISSGDWDSNSVKAVCIDTMKKQVLPEGDFPKLVDEVFGIARCYDKQKSWKLPHHEVVVDGASVVVTVNESGLRAAADAILDSRNAVIATTEEKHLAAAHLKRHFDELKIEAPEALVKVAENAKYADLVVEGDFVLALDDAFVKKITDEDINIQAETIDTEAEVKKVLDAIYIVMRPFVADGAKIDVTEEMYKKLAQSINGAAIGLAAVMNGEGNDIMNLSDNAIISTMRTQINTIKDELNVVSDKNVMLTKENAELMAKVSEYETKVSTIGQLSEDMGKATQLVEDLNNLGSQKLAFLFQHRAVIDEDILKDVIGAKSVDQLETIGKWVSKIHPKRVTVTNSFGDKLTPEPVSVSAHSTEATPVGDKTVLVAPVIDTDKQASEAEDIRLKNIMNLINS